jgi:DEAD/DEAH box helicase domain-containing protein
MDKTGAYHLIEKMRRPTKAPIRKDKPKTTKRVKPKVITNATHWHFGVFDLETQRSADEVGGWHMAHRMGISCGVVYDSAEATYTVYMEDQVDRLIEHLTRFDRVVGFNSKRFDYKVLSGYSDFDFKTLPSLDLLELVYQQLGFRLSLDHLAEQTLQVNKSGTGLDALKWWQAGEVNKVIDYCRKDVQITRDLFIFARDNGYLIYRQKKGDRFRVPLSFAVPSMPLK